MKIRDLIKALQYIEESYGDIEVQLQSGLPEKALPDWVKYVSYPEFFVVPELYEEGMIVNLRNWPY